MVINLEEQRWKKVPACKECMQHQATCGKGTACDIVRRRLRDYPGIRFTSDGFDCALPVTIDSHSMCSFGCLYCFTPNLVQSREKTLKPVGQTSLLMLEKLFSGKGGKDLEFIRKALKYDKKVNGYPCPIQVGGLTDPLDNIERNQGWFLKFAKLVIKYKQPVRISTKGNLFLEQEYLDAVAEAPELFWVNFSIISIDDKVLAKIDRRAPPPSERIQCMKNLSDIGVKTGLRFRPILPGISDATEDHPYAWRDLIDACAKAGATAISYEVGFMPGCMTEDLRSRWKIIQKISGRPLDKIYSAFGKSQACTRPSYKWTEQIMHAIYNRAKEHGLQIGVSDPNWKQLSECGCCCGITKDDPVFGNWQTESATNQLMKARDTGCLLCAKDIIPEWAYGKKLAGMINPGVGPTAAWQHRHVVWADKLREVWDNPKKERSPLNYFQGALIPVKRENGELYYKYVGLKRENPKETPFWRVEEDGKKEKKKENDSN